MQWEIGENSLNEAPGLFFILPPLSPPPGKVPVLVTVTPVNEYSPICPAHTFLVREDAPHGTLVGTVLGSDRDYPLNSIDYHISDSSANFYIDPRSGTYLPP